MGAFSKYQPTLSILSVVACRPFLFVSTSKGRNKHSENHFPRDCKERYGMSVWLQISCFWYSLRLHNCEIHRNYLWNNVECSQNLKGIGFQRVQKWYLFNLSRSSKWKQNRAQNNPPVWNTTLTFWSQLYQLHSLILNVCKLLSQEDGKMILLKILIQGHKSSLIFHKITQ